MIFDQNSALQAACDDASIASVAGCVYPREGCRPVTPLLMPGGQNQASVEFSVHGTVSVAV